MDIFSNVPFQNAIYVGRAYDRHDNYYYYVGQAKNPGRRWEQHLRNETGPCQFGDCVDWAILVWSVPDVELNSAESYLIGYVLSRFGCINGNRGMDQKAFVEGYKDAVGGKPPAICAEISHDALDWQEFGITPPDIIQRNEFSLSEDKDLCERAWGSSNYPESGKLEQLTEDVLKPSLHDELRQLKYRHDSQVRLSLNLRNELDASKKTWFVVGAAAGILFTYVWMKFIV